MKKSFLLIMLLTFVTLFSLSFIIAQDTNIYYPTTYDYPDPNVMSDDSYISSYYGRVPTSGGVLTLVGTDNGIVTGQTIVSEENKSQIYDKVFGETSGEIPGDGIVRSYSKVKYINLIPDVIKISIWFDNFILKESLGYGKATQTYETLPGITPYEIHNEGELIYEDEIDLEQGKEHYIFITGILTLSENNDRYSEELSIKVTVIKEQPLTDKTKAGLSFFNSVPFLRANSKGIGLRLGSNMENILPVFSDSYFRDYSDPVYLEPGNYLVDIIDSTSGTSLSMPVGLNLEGGKKYFVLSLVPQGYGAPRDNN